MSINKEVAKQLRQVHFGGNWTSVNLKETLTDVHWQQATQKVLNFNTIAVLVFHMNYYIDAVMKVLQGEPLTAKDKYSFDHRPIESAADWESMKEKLWKDAEAFALLIENLPDNKLQDIFIDEKYGNYYRNLSGIIEHCHYHLGQIVIIKKLL